MSDRRFSDVACRVVVAAVLSIMLIAVPARAQRVRTDSRVDNADRANRSDSNRLITGEPGNVRRAIDGTVAGTVSFFQLKPIAAQGNVTYGPGVHFVDRSIDPFDLTFNLDGGTNERLFYELQAGGWGGHMSTARATIDWVPGYASGSGAALERPVVPCDPNNGVEDNATCVAALGAGSQCNGFNPNSCRDAFVDATDPLLTNPGIVDANQAFMVFGANTIGGPGGLDVGQVGYNGTVAVDVPADAAGTYTIGFKAGSSTFMRVDGVDIVIDELRPVIINIASGRCCVEATGACLANATQISCDAAGGTFFLGGECTVGACCTMGFGGPDCNANGVPDVCEIVDADCNGNNTLDECDITSGTSADCNSNGLPDECDTAGGTSADCNADMIPDECQPNDDCNFNNTRDICDIGAGTSGDCNADLVPDECQSNADCNANGVQDICDIGSGASTDCNANLIPDDCDIADGTSVDANGDLVPDECCQPRMPMFVQAAKSRYLSLASMGTPGVRSAIRVTCGANPWFPAIEGRTLWVGPPQEFPEEDNSDPTLTFTGAALSCQPYYHDWSGIGMLHIFGPEITPNSAFTVQFINEGCPDSSEFNFSPPLPAPTGQFGDTLAPFFPQSLPQPDFTDINASVIKFLGNHGAPIKAIVQLVPNVVGPDGSVSFRDINADVQSFLGGSYLDIVTDAQVCDCPSSVTCGATACAIDADCPGGFCVMGFCADACKRCSP